MLPELTNEQKERFENGFREIMADAPKELQQLWDGEVHWYPSEKPLILHEIISNLKANS